MTLFISSRERTSRVRCRVEIRVFSSLWMEAARMDTPFSPMMVAISLSIFSRS